MITLLLCDATALLARRFLNAFETEGYLFRFYRIPERRAASPGGSLDFTAGETEARGVKYLFQGHTGNKWQGKEDPNPGLWL